MGVGDQILLAVIGGFFLVAGAAVPALINGRRSRKELLRRTDTGNGKTLAELVTGLASKEDLEVLHRELRKHIRTDDARAQRILELIAELALRAEGSEER